MSITVKPVTPDFVAEISGLDLAQPLKPADRDAIEAAINRYAIVVFHDQKLTDEQQIDFARHFGPIHSSAQKARHTGIKHRMAAQRDRRHLQSRRRRQRAGGQQQAPARLAGQSPVAYRRLVPRRAGRAVHALCPCRARRGRRHRVRRPARGLRRPAADDEGRRSKALIAEHSIWHSRGQLAVTKYTTEELKSLPPVPQRVVRTPSRLGSQDALRREPRLAHHRHADRRRPVAADGPDRARDAARSSCIATPGSRATW